MNISEMVDGGFTMRWPAAGNEVFAPSAAEGLVGTFTTVNARAFGIEQTWRMKIIDATVVDDGAAIMVTLRQPEFDE